MRLLFQFDSLIPTIGHKFIIGSIGLNYFLNLVHLIIYFCLISPDP